MSLSLGFASQVEEKVAVVQVLFSFYFILFSTNKNRS
jgi:hypothetical protein